MSAAPTPRAPASRAPTSSWATDRPSGSSEPFDVCFARFGTMFFANPAAAMANLRRATRPAGGC